MRKDQEKKAINGKSTAFAGSTRMKAQEKYGMFPFGK